MKVSEILRNLFFLPLGLQLLVLAVIFALVMATLGICSHYFSS